MFKNIKNSMNSAKEKVYSVASDLTSTMAKIQNAVDESSKIVKVILTIGTALYVANSVINLVNLICKKEHTLYVFNVYEK